VLKLNFNYQITMISTRTLFFLFLILFISCKKEKTSIEDQVQTPIAFSTNTFLNATIDSATVFESISEEWINSSGVDTLQNLINREFASVTMTGDNQIVVYFENNQFQESSYNASQDDFLEVFTAGAREYDTIPTGFCNARDISVGYYENLSGTPIYWDSKIGDQTGSYFNVTEANLLNSTGLKKVYVGGTFSCKVYNMANPDQFKVISNASFYLDFVK